MCDVMLEFVGTMKTYRDIDRVLVGVKDVARAHIFAYESPHALVATYVVVHQSILILGHFSPRCILHTPFLPSKL
jgi:hypothetical protein